MASPAAWAPTPPHHACCASRPVSRLGGWGGAVRGGAEQPVLGDGASQHVALASLVTAFLLPAAATARPQPTLPSLPLLLPFCCLPAQPKQRTRS